MICTFTFRPKILIISYISVSILSLTTQADVSVWRSWGNSEICTPKKIVSPTTLEEISALIEQARQEKSTIRFVGSGHAPLELTCTNGYIVKTDNFNKIINVDTQTGYVIVESGIKIKHLIQELADYNLALPNQGLITEQSIAGALSTGTHGSGSSAAFSDFVESIELIDGTGFLHKFTKKETPHELAAACLNLGSLGFIYRITLKCVPAFSLEHARTLTTWSEIFKTYKELFKTNDHLMLMGHPYTEDVLLHTWKKTDQEPTGSLSNTVMRAFLFSNFTATTGFYAAYYFPTITNSMLKWYLYLFQQNTYSDLSSYSLSLELPKEPEHYFEGEIALPLESFPQAINAVKRLYDSYKQSDLVLVGILFCRFVKASTSSLLSPAYEQDMAYISFFEMGDPLLYRLFYEEIQKILVPFGGRPHWGKHHTFDRAKFKEIYGQRLEEFNTLRRKLDPYNIFTNECTRKIFSFYS